LRNRIISCLFSYVNKILNFLTYRKWHLLQTLKTICNRLSAEWRKKDATKKVNTENI
jgi:hypothetical protein